MKKLIILLFSFVLISSFSIPVFASTTYATSFSIEDYQASTIEMSVAKFLIDCPENAFVVRSKNSSTVILYYNANFVYNKDTGVISATSQELTCNTRDVSFGNSGSTVDLTFGAICSWSSTPDSGVVILASNYAIPTTDGDTYMPEADSGSTDIPDTPDDDSFNTSVLSFFTNFFTNLKNFFVSLIIPEDGFFESFINDKYTEIQESSASVLLYPVQLLTRFIAFIADAATNTEKIGIVTSEPVSFKGFQILPKLTLDFNSIKESAGMTVFYTAYMMLMRAFLTFFFLRRLYSIVCDIFQHKVDFETYSNVTFNDAERLQRDGSFKTHSQLFKEKLAREKKYKGGS